MYCEQILYCEQIWYCEQIFHTQHFDTQKFARLYLMIYDEAYLAQTCSYEAYSAQS